MASREVYFNVNVADMPQIKEWIEQLSEQVAELTAERDRLRAWSDALIALVPEEFGDNAPLPPLSAEAARPALITQEQIAHTWVLELIAERDDLQDAIVEQTQRLLTDLRHAEAERDAAQARLVEEQRAHEATLSVMRQEHDVAVAACEERNRIEAELERQRPVIEAARAFVHLLKTLDDGNWDELRAGQTTHVLIAAVDALGAGPAGEEGGGDG